MKILAPKERGSSTEKEGERLSHGWELSKGVLLPWWSPKAPLGTPFGIQAPSHLPLPPGSP